MPGLAQPRDDGRIICACALEPRADRANEHADEDGDGDRRPDPVERRTPVRVKTVNTASGPNRRAQLRW